MRVNIPGNSSRKRLQSNTPLKSQICVSTVWARTLDAMMIIRGYDTVDESRFVLRRDAGIRALSRPLTKPLRSKPLEYEL